MGRKRRNDADVHGLAIVDKPSGVTSHDVVSQLRRRLGTGRIGHSGTLDPSATGVLLLGVGRATRLLRFTGMLPKRYVATMVLGTETTTLDADGDVTETHDMANVTLEDVRRAAAGFVGDIEQIPPMVSAVKVDGKRLHELAREGVKVEREPRSVTVHELGVVEEGRGRFTLDVTCSSGTYIRTLAADIGAALGGGAYVAALRRVAIGEFTEAHAAPPSEVELGPARAAVDHLATLVVDTDDERRVSHGQLLDPDRVADLGPGPFAVVGPDERLLAVYERSGGRVKPAVVLSSG